MSTQTASDQAIDPRAAIRARYHAYLAERLAANPYVCLVFVGRSKTPRMWGQFGTVEQAHAAGRQAMAATGAGDRPYGKRCAGYRIVDARDGITVDVFAERDEVA